MIRGPRCNISNTDILSKQTKYSRNGIALDRFDVKQIFSDFSLKDSSNHLFVQSITKKEKDSENSGSMEAGRREGASDFLIKSYSARLDEISNPKHVGRSPNIFSDLLNKRRDQLTSLIRNTTKRLDWWKEIDRDFHNSNEMFYKHLFDIQLLPLLPLETISNVLQDIRKSELLKKTTCNASYDFLIKWLLQVIETTDLSDLALEVMGEALFIEDRLLYYCFLYYLSKGKKIDINYVKSRLVWLKNECQERNRNAIFPYNLRQGELSVSASRTLPHSEEWVKSILWITADPSSDNSLLCLEKSNRIFQIEIHGESAKKQVGRLPAKAIRGLACCNGFLYTFQEIVPTTTTTTPPNIQDIETIQGLHSYQLITSKCQEEGEEEAITSWKPIPVHWASLPPHSTILMICNTDDKDTLCIIYREVSTTRIKQGSALLQRQQDNSFTCIQHCNHDFPIFFGHFISDMQWTSDGRYLLGTGSQNFMLVPDMTQDRVDYQSWVVEVESCRMSICKSRLYSIDRQSIVVSCIKDATHFSTSFELLPHVLWNIVSLPESDMEGLILSYLDQCLPGPTSKQFSTAYPTMLMEEIFFSIIHSILSSQSIHSTTPMIAKLLACSRLLYYHALQIAVERRSSSCVQKDYRILFQNILQFCDSFTGGDDVQRNIIATIIGYTRSIMFLPIWENGGTISVLDILGPMNLCPTASSIVKEGIMLDMIARNYNTTLLCHPFLSDIDSFCKLWIDNAHDTEKEIFYGDIVITMITQLSNTLPSSSTLHRILTRLLSQSHLVLRNIEVAEIQESCFMSKFLPIICCLLWNRPDFSSLVEYLFPLLQEVHRFNEKTERLQPSHIPVNAFTCSRKTAETPHPYTTEEDGDYDELFPFHFPGADFIVLRFSSSSAIGSEDEIMFYTDNDSMRGSGDTPFFYDNVPTYSFDLDIHKIITFDSDQVVIHMMGMDPDLYGFHVEAEAYFFPDPQHTPTIPLSIDMEGTLCLLCSQMVTNCISVCESDVQEISSIPPSWFHEKDGLLHAGLQIKENPSMYDNEFLMKVVAQEKGGISEMIEIVSGLSNLSNVVLGGDDQTPALRNMEIRVFVSMLHHAGLAGAAQRFVHTLERDLLEHLDEKSLSAFVFLWREASYIREWAFNQHHDLHQSYSDIYVQVEAKTSFLFSSLAPIICPTSPTIPRNIHKRRSSSRRSSSLLMEGGISTPPELSSKYMDTRSAPFGRAQRVIGLFCKQTFVYSSTLAPISSSILQFTKKDSININHIQQLLENRTELCLARANGYKQLLCLLKSPAFDRCFSFCKQELTMPKNALSKLPGANVEAKRQFIQQYYNVIDRLLPEENRPLHVDILYLTKFNIRTIGDFQAMAEKRVIGRMANKIISLWENSFPSPLLRYLVLLFSLTVIQCVRYHYDVYENHMTTRTNGTAGTDSSSASSDSSSSSLVDGVLTEILATFTTLFSHQLEVSSAHSWIVETLIDLLYDIRKDISTFHLTLPQPSPTSNPTTSLLGVLLKSVVISDSRAQSQLIQIIFHFLKFLQPSTFGDLIGVSPTVWCTDLIYIIGSGIKPYFFGSIQESSFLPSPSSSDLPIHSIGKRKSLSIDSEVSPSRKVKKLEETAELHTDAPTTAEQTWKTCLLSFLKKEDPNASIMERKVIREIIWMVQRLCHFPSWSTLLHSILYTQLSSPHEIYRIGAYGGLGGFAPEHYFGDWVVVHEDDKYSYHSTIVDHLDSYYLLSPVCLTYQPPVDHDKIKLLENPLRAPPASSDTFLPLFFDLLLRQYPKHSLSINVILRCILRACHSTCHVNPTSLPPALFPFLRLLAQSNTQISLDSLCTLEFSLEKLRATLYKPAPKTLLTCDALLTLLKEELPFYPFKNLTHTPPNSFEIMIPTYVISSGRECKRKLLNHRSRALANFPLPHAQPCYHSYYFEMTYIPLKKKAGTGMSSLRGEFGICVNGAPFGDIISLDSSGILQAPKNLPLHLDESFGYKEGRSIGCALFYPGSDGKVSFGFFHDTSDFHDPITLHVPVDSYLYPFASCTGVGIHLNFGQEEFQFRQRLADWESFVSQVRSHPQLVRDDVVPLTNLVALDSEEEGLSDFSHNVAMLARDVHMHHDPSSFTNQDTDDSDGEMILEPRRWGDISSPSSASSDSPSDSDMDMNDIVSLFNEGTEHDEHWDAFDEHYQLHEGNGDSSDSNDSESDSSESSSDVDGHHSVFHNEWEDSEDSEGSGDDMITPPFRYCSNLSSHLTEKYTQFEWRERAQRDPIMKIPPKFQTKESPHQIYHLAIGDIVGHVKKKITRVGFIKKLNWMANLAKVDFVSSQEWWPVPSLSVLAASPPKKDIISEVIENEEHVTQKLTFSLLSALTPHLSLAHIFGDGTKKNGNTIFYLLCNNYISIPVQDKLDVVYEDQGKCFPTIHTELRTIFDHVRLQLRDGLMDLEGEQGAICVAFLHMVKEELEHLHYHRTILQTKVNSSLMHVESKSSSEMVICSKKKPSLYLFAYYDEECEHSAGVVRGGLHIPVKEIYIQPITEEDICCMPRGLLLPSDVTLPPGHHFSFLWGACILILELLCTEDEMDAPLVRYLTNWIDSIDLLPLIRQILVEDSLGIDGYLLHILNQFLQQRSKEVGARVEETECIKEELVPWVLFNVTMNFMPNSSVNNSAWGDACVDFCTTQKSFFPSEVTRKKNFDLTCYSCRSSFDSLNMLTDPTFEPLASLRSMAGRYFGSCVVRESQHPYTEAASEEIVFPHASSLMIAFDQRSSVRRLQIYRKKGGPSEIEYDTYSMPYQFSQLPQNSVYYTVKGAKELDAHWGYKFTVIPVYDRNGAEKLFEENSEEAKKILGQLKTFHDRSFAYWTRDRDIQLVALLDYLVSKDQRGYFLDVYQTKELLLALSDDVLERFPLLKETSTLHLLYRASLFIDMNDASDTFCATLSFQPSSLPKTIPYLMIHHKEWYLFHVKKEHLQNTFERLYSTLTPVSLVRHSDVSIFNQVFVQLQSSSFGLAKEQFFSVNFVGEDGIDEGGLFRDAISQLIADIQSTLFIQTLNSQNNPTERPTFIPHPKLSSATDLRKFEFIGRLIAISLMTCTVLSGASWPLLVWKSILGIAASDDDMKSIDSFTFKNIDVLLQIDSPENKEEEDAFFDVISSSFSVTSLDGREIDLIPNGSDVNVDWINKQEYIDAVLDYRRKEIQPQLDALHTGFRLETKNDFSFFSWFSPRELKELVEGNQMIDVSLLKFHTVYSQCKSDSQVVRYLWNVLESFDQDQLKAFLRFTSGSAALPAVMTHRNFIVFLSRTSIDYLPTAHTCSWQLDLPKYTSEELLREKLLLALRHGNHFGFA